MSAFVCGKGCIEDVLGAVYDHWSGCVRAVPKLGADDDSDDCIRDKLEWLGNEFHKLNVKSYNARYGESNRAYRQSYDVRHMDSGTTEKYMESLARAIRQIHCIKYQSCEFDGYEKDWRWKALEAIQFVLMDAFVCASDIYNKCDAWG